MRTLFAVTAFLFFAVNAATMSPDGWDAGLRPAYEMFRVAFIGLSLLSLTVVEWTKVRGLFDRVVAEDGLDHQ